MSYEEKYAHLKPALLKIAEKNPSYGYRRTKPELKAQYGIEANHKVILKLHRCWEIAINRSIKAPQPGGVSRVIKEAGGRANLVAGIDEIQLFQVLYTDFTELIYAGGRKKAILMPLLEHVSKITPGWALGRRRNTDLALEAWKKAKNWLNTHKVPIKEIIVHQDQDSVYTGYGWTGQVLIKDGARLSYALRGAKDNPEMESFNGRFKGENRSLFLDADNLEELKEIVNERMLYYIHERRHSAIGYLSPMKYLQNNWMKPNGSCNN